MVFTGAKQHKSKREKQQWPRKQAIRSPGRGFKIIDRRKRDFGKKKDNRKRP